MILTKYPRFPSFSAPRFPSNSAPLPSTPANPWCCDNDPYTAEDGEPVTYMDNFAASDDEHPHNYHDWRSGDEGDVRHCAGGDYEEDKDGVRTIDDDYFIGNTSLDPA